MSKNKVSSRRNARAKAFQLLYGLTFSAITSEEKLRAAFASMPAREETTEEQQDKKSDAELLGYSWDLVYGVWNKLTDLDAAISRYSQHWRIERMGKVELTILRIAMCEMLHRSDIPPKVAINEAIELSKMFGDDNSRGFINGILDAAIKGLDNKTKTS